MNSFINMLNKVKSFITEFHRVLKITKKPNADEYKKIVMVSGVGILVIGAIGFLLSVIFQIIR